MTSGDEGPVAVPEPQEQPESASEQAPSAQAVAAPVTFVKRARGNRSNLRKKPEGLAEGLAGGDSDGEDATRVERKAKVARGEPLAFATKLQQGPVDTVHVAYETNRALPTGRDESVFKMLQTETETDRDARALRESVLQQGRDGKDSAAAAADGTYKGMKNYIDYRSGFRREHTVGAEKGAGAHGPLRANMYVRMTALMDYNPSICKDYKETGFCSYGDSCKFLHDRGDYKQSWELDRDWELEQKQKLEEKMRALERGGDSDEEGGGGDDAAARDDDLPFACYICRQPWGEAKNPVVTRCKHYFCEACALKHNAKSSKCAVCEQATQGIFNVANDILKKMKRMAAAPG